MLCGRSGATGALFWSNALGDQARLLMMCNLGTWNYGQFPQQYTSMRNFGRMSGMRGLLKPLQSKSDRDTNRDMG